MNTIHRFNCIGTDDSRSFSNLIPDFIASLIAMLSHTYSEKGEKQLSAQVKKINSLLTNGKLVVSYSTFKMAHLFKNKDKLSSDLASNVVYRYDCERCQNRYIGETTRHLATRIKEHLTAQPIPTEISLHEHPPRKENFTVISRSSNVRLCESIAIRDAIKSGMKLLNERESSVPIQLNL